MDGETTLELVFTFWEDLKTIRKTDIANNDSGTSLFVVFYNWMPHVNSCPKGLSDSYLSIRPFFLDLRHKVSRLSGGEEYPKSLKSQKTDSSPTIPKPIIFFLWQLVVSS
jgi:hypothetical protein